MEPDWNVVARASLDKWDAVLACSSSLRAAYALGKRDIQKWLPIADAPRDGSRILAWCAGMNQPRCCRWGHVWEGIGPDWYFSPPFNKKPTHYMPLPSPPEEAANAQA